MRVIAGSAKGRKLQAPRGMTTRPTPARVRESLFSMLGPYLDDAAVLDLFAGTGALGIESVSRGAKEAVFVDADRRALEALRHNVAFLGNQATVLTMSAAQAMRWLAGRKRQFGIIFLDPPYAHDLLAPTLAQIVAHKLLAPEGVVVCEHHGKQLPPPAPPPLTLLRTRRFGDVALSLLTDGAARPSGKDASP